MELLAINNIWKIHFDKLVRGFQVLTPEWSEMKRLKNFERLSMREVRFPVDLRVGGSIALTADGGATAKARNNTPEEATISWNHMTGRFEVSYDVFNSESDSKFTENQIKKQIAYQLKDKLMSFKRSMAIQFYGSSDAVLCKVSSIAGAVVTLKDRYGVAGSAPTVDWFQPNKDVISVHISGTPATSRGFSKITAKSSVGPTLTLTAAPAGTAANDLIVLANHITNSGDSSNTTVDDDYNKAMIGLTEMATATSLHGINSATAGNEDWTPAFDTALSAKINHVQCFADWATIELNSGYTPDRAISTVNAIAQAGGGEIDQKRYTEGTKTMSVGFDGITVMGVKVEPRLHCPPGQLHVWASEALRKFSPDEDIKKVSTGGPSEFVYGGTYLGYFCDHVFRYEMTTTCRKAYGRRTAVTEA